MTVLAYAHHDCCHADDGFALSSLLASLSIISVLAAFALPTYQKHVLNARLHRAETALMANAQFMERYYSQNARFTKNSTEWPTLPINETQHFTISFTGTARGAIRANNDNYRLQAVAKNTVEEPRYLTIDHNHIVQLCSKNGNSARCAPR